MISETIEKKTHVLGTPDTKRNGLNTLNARKAFTSKPSGIIFAKRALNPLNSSNRSKKNTHIKLYLIITSMKRSAMLTQ